MELSLTLSSPKPNLSIRPLSTPTASRAKLCQWDLFSLKTMGHPLFSHHHHHTLSLSRNNNYVIYCQKKESLAVEGSSIEDVYDALAKRLVPTAAVTADPNFKYIVGLAGPPGAGKTTLASEVVKRVNKLWPQKASSLDSQVNPPDVAAVLPMDGFHLYRSQLDAMEGSVSVPSFDHGVGDPVEDDIFVTLEHKVVIVEGNYIFLEDGSWKEISSIFDEKWFIDIDIDKAMKRVLKRHISTGKPPDVAKWRIQYNDRPNAELIIKSKRNADLIIHSVDFQN